MFKRNLLSTAVRYSLLLGATAFAGNIYAAEAAEEVAPQETKLQTEQEDLLGAEDIQERVVVTGSRIRKAEFSQASPIQVISGDVSREMGMFDASSMLQSTNQSAGIQIDNSFGG
ncbi:hypothetical protein [Shewanella septentrionalis]|uniref:TonB-dependent receptor n=2 Tax=Shewanella TaxID=22 RepID=A0A9X2WXU9_9GAMM|nr:hypothetical protein [Shewanella septentrionalis]MCT7947159.1 hypothetical protein [Shewanella septentrionalis]